MEDLDDRIPLEPAGVRSVTTPLSTQAPSSLPGVGAQPVPMPVQLSSVNGNDFLVKLGANTVVSGIAAGVIGGFIGFLASENIQNPAKVIAHSESQARTQAGVAMPIFGLGLGAVIMAWEGITSRSAERAMRDGALGAVVGAVAGFIGGYIAQAAYSKLLGNDPFSISHSKLILARVVGWAVMGALIGPGIGLKGGMRKAINGLIGGVLGAAAGGLIFQLIDNSSTSDDGFITRLIGLTITGLGIGAAIGLVERVRRDSWVQIIGGPMAGKEFILYNAETRLGRDYRNDIVLAKDAAVAPFHASFVRDAAGSVTVVPAQGAAIAVNNVASGGQRLRSNDIVTIGSSAMQYQQRAAPGQ